MHNKKANDNKDEAQVKDQTDDKINENDDLVFIESVKATESIKAPFDCIIKDINNDLEDNLDQLNGSPECIENSWLIKIDKLDA